MDVGASSRRSAPKKSYKEKDDDDDDEDYIPGDELAEDWNEEEDFQLKEENDDDDFNPADKLQVTMNVTRKRLTTAQKRQPRTHRPA